MKLQEMLVKSASHAQYREASSPPSRKYDRYCRFVFRLPLGLEYAREELGPVEQIPEHELTPAERQTV
jgi:hypothetical protein